MRLLLSCLCLLIFFCAGLCAQEKVQSPAIIMEPLPEKGIYRFSAFTDGEVVMRNGMLSSEKLNFNISLDEMHFISKQGDTLSLAEPATIRYITMAGSRFYYDKGYFQTIDSAGGIMLAFKQLLSVQQHRPTAYGMTEPHEGIREYSFYSNNGKTDKIGGDEKVTISARDIYFFGDAYGHFVKTSKDFILQHFEKHQNDIKAFLQTNHTNFNKLADLLKLMKYCSRLDA